MSRHCAQCRRPDAPVIRPDLPCTCGADASVEQGWAPDADHAPDCQRIGHEVVWWIYPQLLLARDLVRDAAGEFGQHGYALPRQLRLLGWQLREAPTSTESRRVFGRQRLLCHACITEEMDRRDRQREYVRASREREGRRDLSWSSSISSQDSL